MYITSRIHNAIGVLVEQKLVKNVINYFFVTCKYKEHFSFQQNTINAYI